MKLEYTGGKPLPEFFRIMSRNFSSGEWNEIRGPKGSLESQQISMFCRHWALKESYVKALSVGITVDLKELDFQTHSELAGDRVVKDTVLFESGVQRNWVFEESLIDHDHCTAVALELSDVAEDSVKDRRFVKLGFEDLVKGAVPRYPEDDEYCRKYFTKSEKP